MTNETTTQAALMVAGASSPAFMEGRIIELKSRLEETLERSHTPAHWEGMIEDCEIILKHIESDPR